MALYNVNATGTRTSGASSANDWSNSDTWNISNLQNAMKAAIEAGDGNELVLDDDVHTRTVNVNTVGFNGGTNTLIIRPRFSAATLQSAADNVGLFTLTHATNAMTFQFEDINFRRADGFSCKGINGYELIQIRLVANATFNDCSCDRVAAEIADANGRYALFARVADSNAKTVIFNNFRQSGASIIQTRTSGPSFAGVAAGIMVDSANSDVSIINRHFSHANISGDSIDFYGIDLHNAGAVNLSGDNLYEEIYAGLTTAGSHFNGTFTSLADGLTQDADSILKFKNIKHSVPAGGPFGFYSNHDYNLAGTVYGKKCLSSSTENSVGGLLLGITSVSQGVIGSIISDECTAPFGSAFYVSDGAGATVGSIVANANKTLNGVVYKGGGGSATIGTVIVANSKYYAENTWQPADALGAAVYGHMHPSTSTADATYNISSIVETGNEDLINNPASVNADKSLIHLRNGNATYSISQTIGKVVSSSNVPADRLNKVIDLSSAGVTQTITAMQAVPKSILAGLVD